VSENQKTNVDANSGEFTRGVEAGRKSEHTKYWQAGYKLGQDLGDRETKEPVKEDAPTDPNHPLFLRGTWHGHKDDPQDEQDKSAE
jgi:hypothetical protein